MTAAQITTALRSGLASLGTQGDKAQAHLFSTLQFVQQSLPEQLKPLLTPLGMHEGYVDANYLEDMTKQIDEHWTRASIDCLMQTLVSAGLLRDLGQAIFELHPLLTSYLRSVDMQNVENPDQWTRAFVDLMARLADQLGPLALPEQRTPFHIFGQSLHQALTESERLGMPSDTSALRQSLAAFALNSRNFTQMPFGFMSVSHRNRHVQAMSGERQLRATHSA
jgi:hypothetical protein